VAPYINYTSATYGSWRRLEWVTEQLERTVSACMSSEYGNSGLAVRYLRALVGELDEHLRVIESQETLDESVEILPESLETPETRIIT
jgi:hypothetical protein